MSFEIFGIQTVLQRQMTFSAKLSEPQYISHTHQRVIIYTSLGLVFIHFFCFFIKTINSFLGFAESSLTSALRLYALVTLFVDFAKMR